jgi:hypothetical protein
MLTDYECIKPIFIPRKKKPCKEIAKRATKHPIGHFEKSGYLLKFKTCKKFYRRHIDNI